MPLMTLDESVIGKILAQNVICPQTHSLLLKAGIIITNAHLSSLKKRNISSVFVEESSSLFISPNDVISLEIKKKLLKIVNQYTSRQKEANRTDRIYAVSQIAPTLIEDIVLDQSLIEFCVLLKITNNELFVNSLYVAGLSLLLSGVILNDSAEIIKITKAALLHDIGLIETPYLVGKKLTSPMEEAMWREHVNYGYYLAKEKNIDPDICFMIQHHHEAWDGSGYPSSFKAENIPLGSRIISVCDTYEHMIRFDKQPRREAIEYLYGAGNIKFDVKVVTALSNNLAVYQLGSLVQINTGEIGVVINIRKNEGPRPIVRICFNRVNRPIMNTRDIDLGQELTTFITKIF